MRLTGWPRQFREDRESFVALFVGLFLIGAAVGAGIVLVVR
jgi:hypothetical protein